jgi:hypothetical protein
MLDTLSMDPWNANLHHEKREAGQAVTPHLTTGAGAQNAQDRVMGDLKRSGLLQAYDGWIRMNGRAYGLLTAKEFMEGGDTGTMKSTKGKQGKQGKHGRSTKGKTMPTISIVVEPKADVQGEEAKVQGEEEGKEEKVDVTFQHLSSMTPGSGSGTGSGTFMPGGGIGTGVYDAAESGDIYDDANDMPKLEPMEHTTVPTVTGTSSGSGTNVVPGTSTSSFESSWTRSKMQPLVKLESGMGMGMGTSLGGEAIITSRDGTSTSSGSSTSGAVRSKSVLCPGFATWYTSENHSDELPDVFEVTVAQVKRDRAVQAQAQVQARADADADADAQAHGVSRKRKPDQDLVASALKRSKEAT